MTTHGPGKFLTMSRSLTCLLTGLALALPLAATPGHAQTPPAAETAQLPSDPARCSCWRAARLLADPRYQHPGYWSPFLLIGNWL